MEILNEWEMNSLFSDAQLELFSNILPSTVDIEELQKTGDVIINRSEHNGIITEIYDYISFDGTFAFVKEHSYPIEDSNYERINALDELISLACRPEREDYEKAARLKQQKDTLLAQN